MPESATEHTPRRSAPIDVWPIFVPSKGRPNSSTLALLRASGLTPSVVVEPVEWKKYSEAQAGIPVVMLPQSSQGIAYVRNFIKDYASTVLRAPWYWMLDDDILAFSVVKERRLVKTPARDVLLSAQQLFRQVGRVGQGALEYGQFAWSAKKDHAIGYCDVAVAVNTERTAGLRYRPEMDLKEDRDFTLQVLASGWLTVRASTCAFTAPKNGSNAGGLAEEYAKAGREEQASRRMEAAWPGVCLFRPKKDGRPDVKIDWRALKPSK